MRERVDQGCQITDLPVEVLRKILAHVPFCTRHSTLPLVCKPWRSLLKADVWPFIAVDPVHEQQEAAILGRKLASPFNLQRFLTWFKSKSTEVEELWIQFSAFKTFCDEYDDNEYFSLSEPVLVPILRGLGCKLQCLRLQLTMEFDVGTCFSQLKACSNLKVLDMTVELAYDVQFEDLSYLTSLEFLSIVVTEPVHFAGVPDSLSSLKNLTFLNFEVSNENYADLQVWFGSLVKLRHVCLRGFRFLTFPEAVTSLTALESLDLSCNDYGVMPESFCDGLTALTGLTSLVSQRCLLHCVPKSFGMLRSLKVLNLDSNSELTQGPSGTIVSKVLLPETLMALTTLHTLVLNNNVIERDQLGLLTALSHLERLDLNNCKLNLVPKCISTLTTLRYLDVGNNDLCSFPPVVSNLQKLQYLFLHGNRRLELDLDALCIATLPNLAYVDVRKCVDGSYLDGWEVTSCMVLLILIALIDFRRAGPTLVVGCQKGVQVRDGEDVLYVGHLKPFDMLTPVQNRLFTRYPAWWEQAEVKYFSLLQQQ